MNTIGLKVKRLRPDVQLPAYGTDGAACFDIHVDSDSWQVTTRAYGVEVLPDRPVVFNTGLAFEVPEGWALMIYSRSGHGFKNDTRLANCVGVIDSDYRGELMVKLTADSPNGIKVYPGDRIAQAMLVQVPRVRFIEVDDLSSTERGEGGFGSTGA